MASRFILSITFLISYVNIIECSLVAQATFNELQTGIDGLVVAYNGKVWYELDFTTVDWDLLPENCTDGGLKFHVHTAWTWGDSAQSASTADRMLDDCNSSYTGKHYDPWYACGPDSASPDCLSNGGCIPPSSVFEESDLYLEQYICDPSNYNLISYTCESSDWSGKYGDLKATYYDNDTNMTEGAFISEVYTSYWELDETILMTAKQGDPAIYSLVIHCNDGEPAFCAPIVREENSNIPDITIPDTEIIEIWFDDAGPAYQNFSITWNKQGVTFDIPESVGMGICSEWYFKLYEYYPYYEGEEQTTARTDCDIDWFGGIYDPTHTCVEDSGSPYCYFGKRCNQTDVTYTCDLNDGYRGCAIGDVSARIGNIIYDTIAGGFQSITLTDPQSPPLFILNERGIVLECLNSNLTDNVCAGSVCENCTQSLAPINNITANPTAQTGNPTTSPTMEPTQIPTDYPTTDPTVEPTEIPTSNPTLEPTVEPTLEPTDHPITTSSPQDDSSDGAALDGGAIAGIIVGIVVLLILIGIIIFVIIARKKKKKDDDVDSHEKQTELNTIYKDMLQSGDDNDGDGTGAADDGTGAADGNDDNDGTGAADDFED